MNSFIQIGSGLVVLALVAYSAGIFVEQRRKQVVRNVLLFLTIGVSLDIAATAFMIMGSSHGPLTLHGLIGYSSLTAMLVDTALLWRLRIRAGLNSPVPTRLHRYSLVAYCWWVAAFITGGLLVALR